MSKRYVIPLMMLVLFLLAAVSLSFSDDKATTEKEAAQRKAVAEKKAADLRAEEAKKEADLKEGYVGSETCKGCHPTQYETYKKSVHSKTQVKGPGSKEACETCHGPGAKHVEKGGGRGVEIFTFIGKNVDPKAKQEKCLACHQENKNQVFWSMSMHSQEDVACDTCHNPHSGNDKSLRKAQPDLCFGCHKDIRTMTSKQSHHPIREGKVLCSDCHDPHGEFGPKMIKAETANELCYKCHSEKRGPYMFEHPPVEENCLTCHNPHGSNHSRLLVQKMPTLCQDCHDSGSGHPPTPYTAYGGFGTLSQPTASTSEAFRLLARSCLNCHTNIHGSNGPADAGQRFVR
ncbi:MAG: DmsE family decaheme c-type cytochrome [Nitrospirae bacterium]|nr:DmsE family decaheme c-type cytochrome [Nitrospirota bacterium]MBF0591380.1 DmsE family decaheme c-type cytochrome [Nitrospirota bacterium]